MAVLTYLSTLENKTTEHSGLNLEIFIQASPADFFPLALLLVYSEFK